MSEDLAFNAALDEAARHVQEEKCKLELNFSQADRVVMGSAKMRELVGDGTVKEIMGLPVELDDMDRNAFVVVNESGLTADLLESVRARLKRK